MGFTGEEAGRFKETYINAFDQMESMLREHAQNLSGKTASHWMNRCVKLQEELLQLYRKQVQERPRPRLTTDAAWEIQTLHEYNFSLADIVKITGQDEDTIAYILNFKRPN
jgi:phage regulator Rha-like protein